MQTTFQQLTSSPLEALAPPMRFSIGRRFLFSLTDSAVLPRGPLFVCEVTDG